VQKSLPVKLARHLAYIIIGCFFDSQPPIDSVLQKPIFRYGLLQNAIEVTLLSPRSGVPSFYEPHNLLNISTLDVENLLTGTR
jgi:hypothetical protein